MAENIGPNIDRLRRRRGDGRGGGVDQDNIAARLAKLEAEHYRRARRSSGLRTQIKDLMV
jgi:hypothetical protein